jgi:hypothetical protein
MMAPLNQFPPPPCHLSSLNHTSLPPIHPTSSLLSSASTQKLHLNTTDNSTRDTSPSHLTGHTASATSPISTRYDLIGASLFLTSPPLGMTYVSKELFCLATPSAPSSGISQLILSARPTFSVNAPAHYSRPLPPHTRIAIRGCSVSARRRTALNLKTRTTFSPWLSTTRCKRKAPPALFQQCVSLPSNLMRCYLPIAQKHGSLSSGTMKIEFGQNWKSTLRSSVQTPSNSSIAWG